jgi:hypothetical protein
MKNDFNSGEDLSEKIKELVVARIEAQVSPNLRLSIGGAGSFDKTEMIMHVQSGDEIGKQIANAHIQFLQAQASGKLISALNSVE